MDYFPRVEQECTSIVVEGIAFFYTVSLLTQHEDNISFLNRIRCCALKMTFTGKEWILVLFLSLSLTDTHTYTLRERKKNRDVNVTATCPQRPDNVTTHQLEDGG